MFIILYIKKKSSMRTVTINGFKGHTKIVSSPFFHAILPRFLVIMTITLSLTVAAFRNLCFEREHFKTWAIGGTLNFFNNQYYTDNVNELKDPFSTLRGY